MHKTPTVSNSNDSPLDAKTLDSFEKDAVECIRILEIYPKSEDGMTDQSHIGTIKLFANRTKALAYALHESREEISHLREALKAIKENRNIGPYNHLKDAEYFSLFAAEALAWKPEGKTDE